MSPEAFDAFRKILQNKGLSISGAVVKSDFGQYTNLGISWAPQTSGLVWQQKVSKAGDPISFLGATVPPGYNDFEAKPDPLLVKQNIAALRKWLRSH